MLTLFVFLLVSLLQTGVERPQFEVISVKACRPADPGLRSGSPARFSPNSVALSCLSLKNLVEQAYIVHANGGNNPTALLRTPIEGAPDWIATERYSITAKAPGEVSQATLMGPMLQTLLEDRFKLRIRRLTRNIPTWDLTVAKGGPKLTPFEEGTCVVDPSTPPPTLPPGQRLCRSHAWTRVKGASAITDAEAITIDEMVQGFLFIAAGRPIINRTGLTGRYNIHVEYERPEGIRTLGADAELTAPSIFTAIQDQFGLKLQSAEGPGEYLVIDNIERPTED